MRPADPPSSLRPSRRLRWLLAGQLLTGPLLLPVAAQTAPQLSPAAQVRPVGDTLYPTLGQAGLTPFTTTCT